MVAVLRGSGLRRAVDSRGERLVQELSRSDWRGVARGRASSCPAFRTLRRPGGAEGFPKSVRRANPQDPDVVHGAEVVCKALKPRWVREFTTNYRARVENCIKQTGDANLSRPTLKITQNQKRFVSNKVFYT